MKLWILLFSLIISITASAKMFQTRSPDGSTSFSDIQKTDSQPVEVYTTSSYEPETQEDTLIKATSETNNQTSPSTKAIHYSQFYISRPADQTTFQNQRVIHAVIRLTPELASGHSLQLLVDGQPYATQTNPNFVLKNLNRGKHQIQARILNNNQTVIATAPAVIIYIHYNSRLTSPQKNNPAFIKPGKPGS